MRHLTKNQPMADTREDKVTKEIIDTYKKFGIDNANPTRAIMRRTGVNVAQATQLVRSAKPDRQVSRPGSWEQSQPSIRALL